MSVIPKNLTRKHVLQAISDIDAGLKTRWGKSKKYDLLYKNKTYAPKEVLGRAICISKMTEEWDVGDFYGGSPTNDLLCSLGFRIVLRQSVGSGSK